jgi:GT2 family glycosyltransferase
MTAQPKISILIPTWNSLDMLKLCLQSIRRHSELEHQVVLHVNEGSDGTLDWVRQNNIEYTHTAENVGICRALNMAVKKCAADYLVYLNDDMYVLPGWDRSLYQSDRVAGGREPVYRSGTMIQRNMMAPSTVLADFGSNPSCFDEDGLLSAFHTGQLKRDDWNGSTWPPCGIHRKWWDAVGGYSEELTYGFYSDIDFSMKLWQLGCRRFHGIGSSLVYHFGEQTTTLVRGVRNRNVKAARKHFLEKWGILPSTFARYYLRAGQPHFPRTPEPDWRNASWERLRLGLISTIHGRLRIAAL